MLVLVLEETIFRAERKTHLDAVYDVRKRSAEINSVFPLVYYVLVFLMVVSLSNDFYYSLYIHAVTKHAAGGCFVPFS